MNYLAIISTILLFCAIGYGQDMYIGPRQMLIHGHRGPQGKKLSDGRLMMRLGPNWVFNNKNEFYDLAPTITVADGTYPLIEEISSGFIQYGVYNPSQDVVNRGDELCFNGSTWEIQHVEFSSFYQNGGQNHGTTEILPQLPGNGDYCRDEQGKVRNDPDIEWKVNHAFKHKGDVYLALQRALKGPTTWRGQKTEGVYYESWLTKSQNPAATLFGDATIIAGKSAFTFAQLKNNVFAIDRFHAQNKIPLYRAVAPRCVSTGAKILCAMRTSADDDDANTRLLDPDLIYSHSSFDFGPVNYGMVRGRDLVQNIYSPAIDPNRFYYGVLAPIPPLLIAMSSDDGRSWTHHFIADRGGIDYSLAYDPVQDILVIAYGGLTYPRKGVAVQYSLDQGISWSSPVNLSDEEGFTDGSVYIGNFAPGKFSISYATSKIYDPGRRVDTFSAWHRVLTFK